MPTYGPPLTGVCLFGRDVAVAGSEAGKGVSQRLQQLSQGIQTELGITTLFVTHDQEEALAVADRVAVMNSGNIEQIGTPEELYSCALPVGSVTRPPAGLARALAHVGFDEP